MKKNDVSRKGDGENSDGQRGTKAKREREGKRTFSYGYYGIVSVSLFVNRDR